MSKFINELPKEPGFYWLYNPNDIDPFEIIKIEEFMNDETLILSSMGVDGYERLSDYEDQNFSYCKIELPSL